MKYEVLSRISSSQTSEKYGFSEGMPLQVQIHLPNIPPKKAFMSLAQCAYELGMKKENYDRKLFSTAPFLSSKDIEPHLTYDASRSLRDILFGKPDVREPTQLNMQSYEGIPLHLKVHTTKELKDMYVVDAFIFEQKVAPIESLMNSLDELL